MIMTAEIMNSRQRFFQALTEADSALRLMPGDTTARMVRREAMDNAALAYLNGARGLRSQGLLLPAEAAYLRALAIDSSCAPAHTELATLYTTLGMVDKSLEQAQKAVDFSPGDPSTHTNLAVVYMNLHRAAQSEAELLRAIAINERYGPAHYFLGALYNASGRTEMAQAEVKRAKDLGYSPRPR
jgi:tetratricopeptide (TPR) repeat protein